MTNAYAHAPISEALLDIRVELPPEVTVEVFDQLQREIATEYPEKAQQVSILGTLGFGADVSAHTEQNKLGLRLRSKDGLWVCQTRLDGFTLSRLKPYTNWNDMQHAELVNKNETRSPGV